MVGRGLVVAARSSDRAGDRARRPRCQDEQRMVMVTGSPAAIEALEGKGYDVGFVGELTEAGVYVDDASGGAAARRGLHDRRDGRGREHAPRRQGADRRDHRGRGARGRGRRERPDEGGQGQGRGQRPGQRRDPAGLHVHQLRRSLPLRRGAQQAARRHHRPGDVVHVHEPERHVAGLQPVQQHASARTAATPRSAATRSPTATPAPAPATCTTAVWSRCATPTRTCRPPTSPCASRTPRQLRHQRRHRVGGQGPAAARRRRSRRTSSRSTWTRPRPTTAWTRSIAQFPDIMQAINLPEQDGRLRPSGDGDDGRQHWRATARRARPRPRRRST